MNEIDQIRAALLAGEMLTSKEAYRRFGALRLAAVIHVLKHRDGMAINSRKVKVGEPGREAWVAEYWIDGQ